MIVLIGILSDAHGNLAGFLKGLALLKSNGADRFYFLGDAVGYVPSWSVVDALIAHGENTCCILGNHEEMVLAGTVTNGEPVYNHQSLVATASISRMQIIQSWPRSLTETLPCGAALFVHGSPLDTQNGYIHADTPLEQFEVAEPFVFCGHSHRPFIRQCGNTMFVNVGSCGLPRDDGRLGSVAIFDEFTGAVRILRYSIEQEAADLMAAFPNVHDAVKKTYQRRETQFFGEILHV